ncbi:MAG: hypothetical protein L6R45_06545 [Anaerolineae bacterium]|nr:hypothetical protein [Anaerolineae bacterium]
MSLNYLTNDVLKQSPDFRANMATAVGAAPVIAVQTDSEKAVQENSANSAITKLVKYIPTESVTLYVAAIAAAPSLNSVWPWITTEGIYWFFAVLTPVLWLVILMSKRKAENLPPRPVVSGWLVWNMVASFVAFVVWALAVPSGPYLQHDGEGVVAGFLALVISSLLSMADPLVGRPVN